MATYSMIKQALSGVQNASLSMANAGSHFLHQSLIEIAMRRRERDTMPKLYTSYRFSENKVVEPTVSSQPTVSAQTLNEISQTSINAKQFKPRPPFMRNDESPDLSHDFNHRPRF